MEIPITNMDSRMKDKKDLIDNCLIYHNKRKKVIFILTPRAGNTSLKYCLTIGELDRRHGAHDVIVDGIGVKRISIKKAYQLRNDCTIIGFCRSPRDRFISSCYKWCKRNELDVDEYINMMKSTSQEDMDMHDRKQFWAMEYNDTFLPDKVFKLEKLIQPSSYSKFREYMEGLDISTSKGYPIENRSMSTVKHKITNELMKHISFIDMYCLRDQEVFNYK